MVIRSIYRLTARVDYHPTFMMTMEAGLHSERIPSLCCNLKHCPLYFKNTVEPGKLRDWCPGCSANWETLKAREGFNQSKDNQSKDETHFFMHGGSLRPTFCGGCGVVSRIEDMVVSRIDSVCLDCFKSRKRAREAVARFTAEKAAKAAEEWTRPDMVISLAVFDAAVRAMEESRSRNRATE